VVLLLKSCQLDPLIIPDEVHEAIRGFKVSKNPPQMILHVINALGLMRDEQFGFRPKHRTSLQLAHLVERITINFCQTSFYGSHFLDVTKAFDTAWIFGFIYKLRLLNFTSCIVHTISSYLRDGTSKRPSRWPRHLVESCGLGKLRWIELPCPLVCMSTT
jgi:hypothetical protein